MLRITKNKKFATEARIVKAVAHATRLLVIDQLLQHREQCVCELTRAVGMNMSTVPKRPNH